MQFKKVKRGLEKLNELNESLSYAPPTNATGSEIEKNPNNSLVLETKATIHDTENLAEQEVTGTNDNSSLQHENVIDSSTNMTESGFNHDFFPPISQPTRIRTAPMHHVNTRIENGPLVVGITNIRESSCVQDVIVLSNVRGSKD